MNGSLVFHATLILLGAFIGAVSQALLKRSTIHKHDSVVSEYANPLVILAYVLYGLTTILTVLAYRGIPLSMGPVLEATSYIYVTFFGVRFFNERMTVGKWRALAIILLGICIYAYGS